MSQNIELNVNGVKHLVSTEPERSLLNVLHDELDLTGSSYGCGEGQCSACTVLVSESLPKVKNSCKPLTMRSTLFRLFSGI